MPDGLDWRGQQDFSGGAWPLQERVPRNGVEDCVNGLFDEDGSVFKRGGGAYKGTAFAASVLSVFDVMLGGGPRTIGLSADQIAQLGADDATPAIFVTTAAGITGMTPRRGAVVAGLFALPLVHTVPTIMLFGGSRKAWASSYTTGTVSVNKGERIVTGVGTLWLANVDAGMTFRVAGTGGFGVVGSVDSDTQITLALPWVAESVAGVAYWAENVYFTGVDPHVPTAFPRFVASAANRLIVGAGDMVAFSAPGDPSLFTQTDFDLLGGGTIQGVQGLGDSALVFSSAGLYRIGNLAYDLTDALGNVQQTLSSEGHDVVLWADNGIAGVDGGVLIPALDDLYTYSAGGVERFAAPGLRKLWRQYVKAGYTLGNAAVHRGHYMVPILNGTTFVDAVVLKLSTGAWSRWSGHSAGVSFAQRGTTASAPPKLLAAQSTRLLDLTGTFDPAAANKNEADGSTHTFTLTCRTERRRDGVPETLRKIRVRYELDDAASDNPTLAAAVAVGRPGSAFTTLTGAGAENVGQTPKTWRVGRRGTEARVRLTSAGPSASLVVRSVEQAWFLSGRQ